MQNGLIFKCWQQIQIKRLNQMQQKLCVSIQGNPPVQPLGLLIIISVCCFKKSLHLKRKKCSMITIFFLKRALGVGLIYSFSFLILWKPCSGSIFLWIFVFLSCEITLRILSHLSSAPKVDFIIKLSQVLFP